MSAIIISFHLMFYVIFILQILNLITVKSILWKDLYNHLKHPTLKNKNHYKRNGFFDRTNLYWNGKLYNRYSEDYKKLLANVYETKYAYDAEYRDILQSTNGYNLTHKIGKSDKTDTVLTEEEFMEQLNILRDRHNIKTKKISVLDILKRYQNRDLTCKSIGDLEKLNIKDLCLINSSRVVGSPILNSEYKQYLSKIKESGIDTIINLDIKADNKHNIELCKKYGLNYFNLPITSDNHTVKIEDINKLLDIMSNHKVYIESSDITKTDANILLALNYLLKENVYIADSVLVGKPYETTQFLNKLNQIIYNFNNNLDTKFVEKMNTLKLVNL